jgi:hypothetical protein
LGFSVALLVIAPARLQGAPLGPLLIVVMPVMHEQVHQWAGKEQQIGQSTEQVGAVLRPEKEQRDRAK